jgi:3'(2'), 5'-bisphosphate nucleotidase
VTRAAAGLDRELRVAERLARDASSAAMRFYGTAVADAGTAASPVTDADRASNEVIVAGLAAAFPTDAVLSEESRDPEARLDAARVWIVDPLDGTKEFLARNGEFAVMIGLASEGRPVLGVVYMPAAETLYSAVEGRGARVERDGRRRRLVCPAPSDSGRGGAAGAAPRIVGSRSHPDPLTERMRRELGAGPPRPAGSVALKCALLAEGECDLYVHPVPYLKEWDTCAPELILREAGGTVTDCLGDPLRYNKPDPVQPHGILARTPAVDRKVVARVIALYRG